MVRGVEFVGLANCRFVGEDLMGDEESPLARPVFRELLLCGSEKELAYDAELTVVVLVEKEEEEEEEIDVE